MAGGPLHPFSVVPITSGRVWLGLYEGIDAILVEPSLGADAVVRLAFQAPESLPTGTAKLRLYARAEKASLVAKVNPKWVSVAAGEDFDAASVNAEGTSTVTWTTGDEGDLKELEVTLDADTVVAGEIIKMDLTFETTGWTLDVISSWIAAIVWE